MTVPANYGTEYRSRLTPTALMCDGYIHSYGPQREPDKIAQGHNRPDIIAQTKWAIMSFLQTIISNLVICFSWYPRAIMNEIN